VAFRSTATDLVPGIVDDNGADDVFVRDLGGGTTSLVTVGADGHAASGFAVEAFTPDGSALLLMSHADLAGDGVAAPGENAFLRNLATGETTLVTPRPGGELAILDDLALSPDGTKVAFGTYSADFGPTDTNQTFDVYVRDLTAGITTLASANAAGTDAGNGGSFQPVFSPDSSLLAFRSFAGDLGPTDGHSTSDVYLRDLGTGTISLVSVNAAGTDSGAGNSGNSNSVAFDPSGTRIAFPSDAGDLGPTDRNFITDVYVRDLRFGITTLVSANFAGTGAGDAFSGIRSPVSFSPDGSRIVYESIAQDLDPRSSPGRQDVYLATPPALADLGITVAASPDPVAAGGDVTLTATATDHGRDAADDVRISVLLPEGTVFAAAGSDGTCADPTPEQPRVVVCDVGALASGGEATATVRATVTAPAGTALLGGAAASSPTFDPGGEPALAVVTIAVGG
jgi:Tol biopolymer transport system component